MFGLPSNQEMMARTRTSVTFDISFKSKSYSLAYLLLDALLIAGGDVSIFPEVEKLLVLGESALTRPVTSPTVAGPT